jgi:thioredoxin-like negative regulator of GroEL
VKVVPPGKPAIVAFSTPSCAECRTRQAPALKQLATQFGEQVEIRSLQATEHPELVDRAGILTVPATVVLDARGVVRHLNLGFTDSETLASQLRSAA